MKFCCGLLALLTAHVAAKTIRIDVGSSGKSFSPDTVTADKGDVLEFHFSKSKHSVVSGDYDKGCSPQSQGGFYSGMLQAKGNNPSIFQVTVESTDPTFFYCSAGSHCQGGMVGVANPSSGKSLATYKDHAKSSGSNVSPDAPYGGKLVKEGEVNNGATATTGSGPSQTKDNTGAAAGLRGTFGVVAGLAAGAAAFLV
ncbi:extracellular serine-rich protein [Purpureocillium lilacinum]|uniref:Extracellular serine-rich protein n=1 Tax=Purpureocillium lilacinum TaxID=33203 RepID=A0A179H9H9_PURLI|nr:extracellular serine-rich protein [Purpureocillium lilacinum]OAQ86348.1 extracellular serine-rich protein [Purpureocillium lilacinum]OAQ94308.1 extracellular serine-rich protein [Purpureocillium lilacinum]GJN81313.1 hypothetical protein PLIIFM63780_004846 [Purpureocillium lilacinum]